MVRFAARHEYARTVEDVLARRIAPAVPGRRAALRSNCSSFNSCWAMPVLGLELIFYEFSPSTAARSGACPGRQSRMPGGCGDIFTTAG
jgi:hypothetical protein